MGEFRMPSLGADMDAGRLVEWHVAVGDAVKRGQIVAGVETQKGLIDVEVWEAGVVEALFVAPGASVPVGTVLARIGVASPAVASPGAPPAPPAAPAHPAIFVPPVASPAPPASPVVAPAAASAVAARPLVPSPMRVDTERALASPAARQLARERGVDLASVVGTGPHGVVTRADVARAAEASPATTRAASTAPPVPPAAPPSAPTPASTPADAMRRAMAAAMARSKREIPHYYLATDLDVSRAQAWLARENAPRAPDERLVLAALLLRATALAAHEAPELNGFFVDGDFHPAGDVHLGVAISLRKGGLVAPAILRAHEKRAGEIMADLRDLVARARAGRLRASEMSSATLTVTNLGDQGVTTVFGVIHPPQVALVGFGKVVERPWAEGGMLGVRPVVSCSLSADHRVSDGHRGGLFLAAIAKHLQEPETL